MNVAAIIDLTVALLDLSAKYIKVAKQNTELTPEQEADFKAEVNALLSQDYWKVDKDPS